MRNVLQEKCKNTVSICVARLLETRTSVAFAESATAGFAAGFFSMVERAGEVLKGGINCYDACVKQDLLGVSKDLVDRYTAESEEVTQAISLGLKRLIAADMHIGITGLLREGGSESCSKPVGTVFVSIVQDDRLVASRKYWFAGDEWEILFQSVHAVAELILEVLWEKQTRLEPISQIV